MGNHGRHSGHDENREAASREELSWDTAEMESWVGRTSHDDEVGFAVLREELELGGNLAASTGEVAANTCLAQFLGHELCELLVALGITDERDRRKETAEGGRPGHVRNETGVDAALLAYCQADGHCESAVARRRAVDPDDDAPYAHALLSRGGRRRAWEGRSYQLTG